MLSGMLQVWQGTGKIAKLLGYAYYYSGETYYLLNDVEDRKSVV